MLQSVTDFLAQVAAVNHSEIDLCEMQILENTLNQNDRIIFFIGCPLVIIATLMLIIGSIKYKELRKQPGDIILGIAISDFILAVHWLSIAIGYKSYRIDVDESQPFNLRDNHNNPACLINGSIGTIAGMSEYLYNIAFNLYLIISLRNALKQDRIPKKAFHVVVLLGSIGMLIGLHATKSIGKTMVGTCSIKSHCKTNIFNFSGPFIVLLYVILGAYTYWYIHKNAPKCQGAHAKRAQFLMYYLKFILASTIIFACISATNFGTTAMTMSYFTASRNGESNYFAKVVISLYNISKLSSPLILSFIRFRDPLIKKKIMKTINYYLTGGETPKGLDNSLVGTQLANQQQVKDENLDTDDDDDEFIFAQLQANRKIEITYNLLSCVLYGESAHRNSARTTTMIADRRPKNQYRHERIFQINDLAIKNEMPKIQDELNKKRINVMPGTLKAYAPEVFMHFLNEDRDHLDLQKSLDFLDNAEQISDASGPGGGRSGEFFFFSRDKKLIVKTIPDIEMQALISILEVYDEHFKTNPRSLIAKIYGAFTFVSTEYGQKYNLIVMKNLNGFPSAFVKRTYDMKGSRYEREVLKGQNIDTKAGLKQFGVLKDLDFEKYEKKLYIKDELKAELRKQLEADSLFFRRVKLIDYSLMVFCIDKKQYEEENGVLNDGFTSKNPLGSMINVEEPGMYYNVGIVDYLQPYNFQKFFEKVIKKVKKLNINLETSTQDPHYYSTRFIAFMTNLIPKENS